jgi:hypothetical protein
VPILRSVLFPHEVQEVLKVRLSYRAPDDHVAWFYEKSGVFSVKSAYHLAMSLECSNRYQVECSARADGSQPVFKCTRKRRAALPLIGLIYLFQYTSK